MKRYVIWIIISLMSVALIGLTGFQVYWISNALKLNQQQFEQNVQESLVLVSQKLEKKDAFDFARHNIFSVAPRHSSQNTQMIFRTGPGEGQEVYILPDSSSRIFHDKGRPKSQRYTSSQRQSVWININTDEDTQAETRVIRKSEMVNVVVEEMFSRKRSIRERIRPQVLDSMLNQEFKERGIDINFEFAVWNPSVDSVIFTNANSNIGAVKNSDLRASLFPNDLFGNVNYLTVHFPNEGQFLFKEIWATLATSIIFILIIIGCFGYAIYTIIRQKKLSEIKNDFINNMTHELKTPIATVGLACEALHEKEMRQDDHTLLRYLDVIKDENKRLGDQVEKVLQSALLDRASFELRKADFHLHQIVNDVVRKIQVQLEARHGDIQVKLLAEKDMVNADPDHISNVIVNLLDNAIKYSGEQPTLEIRTFNRAEGVIIEVADKGNGIRKEDLKRIFDKFYRVHTGDRHDVKGFGLGLSYVKSIVNMHGGEVSARSELHEGSTFTIFLPFQYGE